MPKKIYKQSFRNIWLEIPEFKDWVRKDLTDPTRAYCSFCKCTIAAKLCDLKNHAVAKKHLGVTRCLLATLVPPESHLWKYYTKQDDSTAECKQCLKKIKCTGNTSNLFKHAKTHGAFAAQLNRTKRESSPCTNDFEMPDSGETQDISITVQHEASPIRDPLDYRSPAEEGDEDVNSYIHSPEPKKTKSVESYFKIISKNPRDPKGYAEKTTRTKQFDAIQTEGMALLKLKLEWEREKFNSELQFNIKKMKLDEERTKAEMELKTRELLFRITQSKKDERLKTLEMEKDERLKKFEIEMKYKNSVI